MALFVRSLDFFMELRPSVILHCIPLPPDSKLANFDIKAFEAFEEVPPYIYTISQRAILC